MTIALDRKKLLGFRIAARAENLTAESTLGAKIGAKPVHAPKFTTDGAVAPAPSAAHR